jgi:hypothetical protein
LVESSWNFWPVGDFGIARKCEGSYSIFDRGPSVDQQLAGSRMGRWADHAEVFSMLAASLSTPQLKFGPKPHRFTPAHAFAAWDHLIQHHKISCNSRVSRIRNTEVMQRDIPFKAAAQNWDDCITDQENGMSK